MSEQQEQERRGSPFAAIRNIAIIGMVLLELTPALSARLISLHSALPAELAQLVQQALDVDTPPVLDPSSTAEDENATAQSKTISHEILVKVSLWARNHPTSRFLSSLGARSQLGLTVLIP